MKFLKIVLVIVAGVFLVGYFAADKDKQAAATISNTPKEIVRISARDLFEDYDSNEVATDIQLKGKIVEVTGTVQSIDKSVFDTMYVGLVTRNQFMPAQMHVVKSQEAQIAALHKGNTVTFRCPKMKRWVGSPSGNDCILM
jgi:tRNA_anti-like